MKTFPCSLFAVLLAAAPLLGQRDAGVPDPDPELERKTFIVADGFEVNLWAADPLLAKPIQMNWGPDGRLWLACSEAYPQIKPGQKQNDKIIVLEDTKGLGRADKTTVFADGLLIPTGLAPGDGGVYVVDSTDLLHLSASKGDSKADRRRVVLSGFGTEDTHHMVHTLRWGNDGLLYFNQSIYIHSHIETPHGPRRLNGGGTWMLRPETGQLEVFARGWINHWGHHFDRWGQSFVTDGAGGEGINYVVPGASYPTAVGASRILNGLNPGSPKYCGLEVLSGRHLPDAWQGSMITNDFRGHRVCRFTVAPDGAGYIARQQGDLIRSSHPAFRPIDVKMGPDGAIYIADWYNPIIQHGEVDFRDPRRDVTHGRIWRVTAKGRPLIARPKLVDATTDELLEALKSPEDWTRHQARRVLKERGAPAVVPALAAWTAKLAAGKAEEAPHFLEALWTYQSLDVVEAKLLGAQLRATDPRIRAAATRVLGAWQGRLSNALELLAAQVNDDHPQVRLEAVRALGLAHTARAAEIALEALDRPLDKWLDYSLWLTCRELQAHWLPRLQQGRLTFGGNTRRLVFALQAIGSGDVVRPLVDLVRAGKVPADTQEGVLTLIGSLGGPRDLRLVLERALSAEQPVALRAGLLAALEQAARQRKVRPEGDLRGILRLLDAEQEALQATGARLAGLWQLEAARDKLLHQASASGSSDSLRRAAFDGLVALGGPASKDACDTLCREDKASPATRRLALIALAAIDLEAAGKVAVAIFGLAPDGAGASEVFDAFLQHKSGGDLLARALADQKLPADVARVGIRSVRSTGREAPALVQALTKAGSLSAGPRKLSASELEQMIADVQQRGDPVRGEVIYRRKDQLCLKCHAIAGAGGQVGPDLSSLGASAPVDYLIESLLEPNKKVKEGYHALLVTTSNGKQYSGLKVRQTATELVLRTAEDREIAVPVKEIEEQTQGGSLMPDGLTDNLTQAEFVDLVRYLSELGKIGPFAVGKARLVRRWQVLEGNGAARSLLAQLGRDAAVKDDPGLVWEPAYSTVAGALPLGDLPRLEVGKDTITMAFIRFQLDVTTAGAVPLRIESPRGLGLWLNRTPVAVEEKTKLDLPVGLHTITVGIDPGQRREAVRIEVEDLPGSPARIRVVGGK